MRRIGTCIALLLALLLTGTVSASDKAKADKALRALVEERVAACKAGDLDRLMALYLPDAIVAPHGQSALKGRDAIRAHYAANLGKGDVELKVAIDTIRIHGNSADILSRYWFTATPRNGGPIVRDSGRSLSLYKRDADGRWKIRLDLDQDSPDVRFDSLE